MINRAVFFNSIREHVFGGSLSQSQVTGIISLIDMWERSPVLTDLRYFAYMLATVKWETAHTMQPIAEYGKGKGRKYGKKGKYGQVPYGRGYVQLTWDFNYEKADRELNLKGALLANFDLALRPDVAALILFLGMTQGWFTGKKLSDYFGATADWWNARRIINGTDHAADIANIAKAFYAALVMANQSGVIPPKPVVVAPVEPPKPVVPVGKPVPPPYTTPPPTGLIKGLGVGIVGIGATLAYYWNEFTTWVGCLFSSSC